MARSQEPVPEAASASLLACTGMIYRHGPYPTDGKPVEKAFVCMATRLGNGLWATIHDRGAYGGRVYDEYTGTLQVIDLYVHPLDGSGNEFPIEWGSMLPLEPIALFHAPADSECEGPVHAFAHDFIVPEYQKIYRATLGDGGVFSDQGFDATRSPIFLDGSIYEVPLRQWYRNGADDASRRHTVCVHADMSYPGEKDLGAPVVDKNGRLVGVIIGADLGPESRHAGAYVPIDFIEPHIRIARTAANHAMRKGRHSYGIDFVEHRSTDVHFRA